MPSALCSCWLPEARDGLASPLLLADFCALVLQTTVVDMETEFLNLGLDIIGLGVFNFDFGSLNSESPVIKVRPSQQRWPCSATGPCGMTQAGLQLSAQLHALLAAALTS